MAYAWTTRMWRAIGSSGRWKRLMHTTTNHTTVTPSFLSGGEPHTSWNRYTYHNCPKLCSSNEDFGRLNEHSGTDFSKHFSKHFSKERRPNGVLTPLQSALKSALKNPFPNVRSAVQNLRLGSINFRTFYAPPNEDFGRQNKMSGVHFRGCDGS